MKNFSAAAIFRTLFRSADWRLVMRDDSAFVSFPGEKIEIAYAGIDRISTRKFFALEVNFGNEQILLKWMNPVAARRAAEALQTESAKAQGRAFALAAAEIAGRMDELYGRDFYISARDVVLWLNSVPASAINAAECALYHPHFDCEFAPADAHAAWTRWVTILSGDRQEVARRNEDFVRREKERYKTFFDSVEARPLSEEQKHAAVVMEDRNLLVASAGSGKTSAVVGKIGYIIEKGYCRPSEILTLAFNRGAAAELQERIRKRIGPAAEGMEVATFHKFGLSVIARATKKKPAVAEWTQNMGESANAEEAWRELVEGAVNENSECKNAFMQMLSYFRWAFRPSYLFKNKQQYEKYLLSLRVKRWAGDDRKQFGAPTINGEYVRSLEEASIANWLYMNGVNYEYESPYQFDLSSAKYRQYQPDFYYPELNLYHEHFALDENGKSPFRREYEEEARRKREIHAAHDTDFIETTSAMMERGDLFSHLRAELQKRGAVFRPRSFAEINAKVRKQHAQPIFRLMGSFLTHWKSGGESEAALREKAESLSGFAKLRALVFLRFMHYVRRAYENKLRARGEIDFEDMLISAENHIRNGEWRSPYRVVLADEFQDMSRSRARLIAALLAQNPDCKMFAVGDDWQSIYRFAGADLSVMTNFKQFGETAEMRLEKTFRSNRGIAEAAAEFVCKNPAQFKKTVRTQDSEVAQTVHIINYSDDFNVLSFIARRLQKINADGGAKSYILARYNHLKTDALAAAMNEWKREFPLAKTQFSTIHRVKGKESDYVFVLGMHSGEYGFPSEMEDDPVLHLVTPESEKFAHAEERRLFYVALTRARRKAYLFAKKGERSSFVEEILAKNSESVYESDLTENGEIPPSALPPECPECGGMLVNRPSKYRSGTFVGCTNFPKCRHTQKHL